MEAVWVPIVGAICIALMFITFSYLNSRNHAEIHKSIRAALESGTALTPELVGKLTTNRSSGTVDLRRGVIILSIGLATALAGVVNGDVQSFATAALFPIFIGLGYLLVWKLNKNTDTEQ